MTDEIRLQAKGIWVQKGIGPNRRVLLQDASLTVEPGELVALVGPNGAGKTTLLRAIGGERPWRGEVLLNGENLYDDPESWLPKIGYIPSFNVLHDDLRVRQALRYTGHLRLPEVPVADIKEKVEELLDEFAFEPERREAPIKRPNLSDGERKRLNICAELLTEPALLLLDEPTTGLDPKGQALVMERLRDRAKRERRAIVAVVHHDNRETLKECDRVVFMARGGVIVWQGPPAQLEHWVRASVVVGAKEDWWAAAFGHFSGNWQVQSEKDKKPETRAPTRHRREPRSYLRQLPVPGQQFWVLLRRYGSIMRGNPFSLALNLFMGVLGGLLLFILQRNAFIRDLEDFGQDIALARNAVFVVAFTVVLIGLLVSFREIAKESHIYSHERLKGLSPWAYLLSKWTLLSVMVGVLAPFMVLLVLVFVHNQDLSPRGVLLSARPSWLVELSRLVPARARILALSLQGEGLLTLILTCMATLTLGLALSTFSSNQNTVIVLVILAALFQLVLSGIVENEDLKELTERLSVLATSRWGMEGFSTSLGIYCWANPQFRDFYSLGHLLSVWLFLVVYIFGALVVARVALALKDPFLSKPKALWHVLLSNGVIVPLVLALCLGSWASFLRANAHRYFDLRTEEDVRIENVEPRTLYQTAIGYASEAQCPTPTALPPPATPIVATPPEILIATSEIAATPTYDEETTAIADSGTSTPAVESGPVETRSGVPTVEPTSTDSQRGGARPGGEATITPVPSSTPRAPNALPQGRVQVDTLLQFGPEHPNFPIASVPEGTKIVLLGKDESETWYRIKVQDTGYIGWLKAGTTDLGLRMANVIAAPPACAKPRASLMGNHTANLAGWQSDVDGQVAIVVDLYREQAGQRHPAIGLQVVVNGQVVKRVLIPATEGSFLLRGTTIDADVRSGDQLEFALSGLPAGQATPGFFATIFLVPDRCSFESR